MHNAKNVVAVAYGIDYNTNGKNVVNLLYTFALHKCFLVNSIYTFYSALYINVIYNTLCSFYNFLFYAFYKLFSFRLAKRKLILYFLVAYRIQVS